MSGYELVEVHDPHRDRGRILDPVRGFGVKCPMSETLTLTINSTILLEICYLHTLPSLLLSIVSLAMADIITISTRFISTHAMMEMVEV